MQSHQIESSVSHLHENERGIIMRAVTLIRIYIKDVAMKKEFDNNQAR